jgi:hypothetical protein
MNRTYPASAIERFVTGGGLHQFANFDPKDNGHVMTVRKAFQRSGQTGLYPADARPGELLHVPRGGRVTAIFRKNVWFSNRASEFLSGVRLRDLCTLVDLETVLAGQDFDVAG